MMASEILKLNYKGQTMKITQIIVMMMMIIMMII